MKRLITQAIVFLLTNLNIKGFLRGSIYKGETKKICVPGLNCYSCPGALGSCPIGSLQSVIGSAKYNISLYVTGLLMLFGVIFGRFICGWLCPFGLLEDLIYKIKSRKLSIPRKVDAKLRYLKYAVLIIFVILMPMFLNNQFGMSTPYFCQLICPSGTFFAGLPLVFKNPALQENLGVLFSWKTGLLGVILVLSVFVYRPFCKYLCPLGAVYALFNRVSFIRMSIDPHKCIHCHRCEKACNMQVPVLGNQNHPECIRCGNCKKACPVGAFDICKKCNTLYR